MGRVTINKQTNAKKLSNMSKTQDELPLKQEDWSILQQFLESDKVEEALNIIETHGFLCSMIAGPVEMPQEDWIDFIFDSSPCFSSQDEENQIIDLLVNMKKRIHSDLATGHRLRVPCKLSLNPEPDEAPLRDWALGFMEGFLKDQDQWFLKDEDIMAELTLPILLASGLAEDDDILELEKNRTLCDKLCREIPETITDIFLYFHS